MFNQGLERIVAKTKETFLRREITATSGATPSTSTPCVYMTQWKAGTPKGLPLQLGL
jgi:hypothetical protein